MTAEQFDGSRWAPAKANGHRVPNSPLRIRGGAGEYRGLLDSGRCYEACLSRDRRFDGKFFACVVTTGVYCRPICPVSPAKLENVFFLPSAAAAEGAGFRACMRCHPEVSPGTPAWLGTSTTVSRALRLIGEGALDDGNEESLAERLGIGSRHLRRLFSEHLGASPLRIAITRRAHFARQLLSGADLSVTRIAFSCGFNSLRRFNETIRASFGASPSELRRRACSARGEGDPVELRLAFRPPYDWHSLIAFLRPRAISGVESVTEGVYRRTVKLEEAAGYIEVEPHIDDSFLLLRVHVPEVSGLIDVAERVRRIFDLGADPMLIQSRLGRDRVLVRLIARRPGLRVPGAWDGFELAVRAILGQQVSVKAATTLAGRIARELGRPAGTLHESLTHLFPSPEDLRESTLERLGVTRARAAGIRALAAAVADRRLTFGATSSLDDALKRLTAIPGIGSWTAHYIALRAFGETDAFPSSDLGLRRVMSEGTGLIAPQRLERIAEEWRPWRGYAAMHLWSSQQSGGNPWNAG